MKDKLSLFERVVKETEQHVIDWKIGKLNEFSDLIFQYQCAFRVFEGKRRKPADLLRILLVEKKYPDADWDFELERYSPELYFLEGRDIVLKIDDDDVSRARFGELVKLVENLTPQARRLLE